MLITLLHTKSQMPLLSISLFSSIKTKANPNLHMTAMMYYFTFDSSCIFLKGLLPYAIPGHEIKRRAARRHLVQNMAKSAKYKFGPGLVKAFTP